MSYLRERYQQILSANRSTEEKYRGELKKRLMNQFQEDSRPQATRSIQARIGIFE